MLTLCIHSYDPHPTLSGDVTKKIVQVRKLSFGKVLTLAKVLQAMNDVVRIQTQDYLIPKPRFVLDTGV